MFSLIIPYHNREAFLPRVLQSIIASSIKPDAIILVDNASTDDSALICKKFANSHPELSVVLLTEERKGASYARNKGLSVVQTDWVYFFDSDDELSSDFFEKVQLCLTQQVELDMVCCATLMVFGDGTEHIRSVQYSDSPLHQLLSGQLSTQSMFLRTSFLRSAGGWNEKLTTWDDWELGLRLLLLRPQIFWLKNQAFHRLYQHTESQTGSSFSSTFMGIMRAIQAAETLVQTDDRLILALASRCVIISAQLKKEKDEASYRQMKNFISRLIDKKYSFVDKLYLKILYAYAWTIGYGSWYLSLLFLSGSKKINNLFCH